MESKKCSRCLETKPLTEFSVNKSSPDGRHSLCKPCKTESRSSPSAERIEAERNRSKRYYQENKARITELRKARYAKDKEATLAKNREWRDKHLEQHRAQCRQWAKDNPVAMRAIIARRRAKILEVGGSYSKYDVARLMETQGKECACCSVDLDSAGYHVDHIHPISRGGSNSPDNLQLLCPTCNRRKSNKLPAEWIESRGY